MKDTKSQIVQPILPVKKELWIYPAAMAKVSNKSQISRPVPLKFKYPFTGFGRMFEVSVSSSE